MEDEQGITILEAVETLASIADLTEEESKKLRKTLRLEGKRLGERKVNWLQVGTNETHLGLLRKSLDRVHDYFRTLWREQDPEKLPRDVREGIRTLWVLVGNAVDTLSTYGDLFREYGGSPKNLPEYQELQSFYKRKIDPKIDEGKLGRFVLGIGHLPFPLLEEPEILLKRRISLSPQHLIVDLESLKSDQDYELLLIKKSDGSRFYNPRLIRNLKLISEVGFQEKVGEILPLFTPWRWIDRQCEKGADALLEYSHRIIEPFLKERGKFKERDLSRNLTYSIIALLLSAQPRYLSDNAPFKTTSAFFQDLIEFLNECVEGFDYRRLLTYSLSEHNRLGRLLYQLPQILSHALFTVIPTFPYDGIVRTLQGGQEGRSGSLAEGLQLGYQWIEQELKSYGNSPLKKNLDYLEEGLHSFEPLKMGILPAKIGEMRFGEHTASLHRMAAPLKQDLIDQVTIEPLFMAALREMKARGERVLIFNLQERSHWKDRARAEALEKLSEKEEWSSTLQVVTLDMGSEFYNQELHFERGESAENFIENCRQFLLDENGSNYFSSQVEEILFPGFMEKAFLGIHQLYFSSRNAFTPDMKRHFIDLLNHLLQLKVVDALHPDRVIFLDKDGTDTSSIASTLFMMSPKLFTPEGWIEKDLQTYEALLYSSTLLYRERNLRKVKFDRFVNYLNWLEQAKNSGIFSEEFYSTFSPLLPNGTLAAHFITAFIPVS